MNKIGFALVVLAAAPCAHGLLIDDFSDGAVSLSTAGGIGPQDWRPASVYLGTRGTFIGQFLNNSGLPSVLNVGGGSFAISESFGTASVSALVYGATGSAAGSNGGFFDNPNANFSLAAFSHLDFHFAGTDQPLLMTLQLTDETGSSFYSKAISGGQFSPFTVSLSQADLGGGVDRWSNFDIMFVDFQTASAGDFQLREIDAVPEPLALVGLGLGVVSLLRRRRRAS